MRIPQTLLLGKILRKTFFENWGERYLRYRDPPGGCVPPSLLGKPIPIFDTSTGARTLRKPRGSRLESGCKPARKRKQTHDKQNMSSTLLQYVSSARGANTGSVGRLCSNPGTSPKLWPLPPSHPRPVSHRPNGKARFTIHDLRRSCATELLRRGVAPKTQRILGHANLATTMKY